MCGIAGILERDPQRRADPGIVRAMVESLHHRGPDAGGYVDLGRAVLGIRRLAVIDPAGGEQPMRDPAGRAWIVFNGEIYNYRELARDLTARGARLRTHSDTEVLLHLFAERGVKCLEALNGMFAFAAYDRERDLFLLARDRLGIKPLYYRETAERIWFGSEVKAILADRRVPRELDPQALHDFLAFDYMPAPLTAIAGVRQLLPGTYLAVERGVPRTASYWTLDYTPEEGVSPGAWAERVRHALDEAVRRQLVADVPFGAFLSGGIDSSAVTAFMGRHLAEPVRTFSIGFREPSYNELPRARAVSRALGTRHEELVVDPDIASLLPRLVWHADEPSADSSAVAVYLVSELARRHVTMVLSGDGGDELFAGYETYQAAAWRRFYRALPGPLRRGIVRPLVLGLPVSDRKVSLEMKAKRFVTGAEQSAERAHYAWRNIFSEEARRALYTPAFAARFTPLDSFRFYEEHFAASRNRDPLSRLLHVDTRFYLPNDMLVKVDRMSMAHSLEARVPFLDHTLVELAARVPAAVKFPRLRKKALLKAALRGVVPDLSLTGPKRGFNLPMAAWLRGPLDPLVRETLGRERQEALGIFRPDVVEGLLAAHRSRSRDHAFQIWGLLVFTLWHEAYIEETGRYEPPSPRRPATALSVEAA
jgi:asparagine synthase (glutamine-hydrolysing)